MKQVLQAVALLALIVAALSYPPAGAEITRSISERSGNWKYYRKATTSTTALVVDFGGRAFATQIYNEDASNALLVSCIETGSVAAAELTTPTDGVVSDVQSIPGGAQPITFESQCLGVIFDRPNAGTGAVTIRATR